MNIDFEYLNKRFKELESITKKSRRDINRVYDINGNLKLISYHYYDKLHREEEKGPAHIYFDHNHNYKEERYYLNGKLTRKLGPAVIITKNNEVVHEEWLVNGKNHREDDLPSVTNYFRDHEVPLLHYQKYYFQGKLHRESDLPAVIKYCIDHEFNHYKSAEEWWKEGCRYRQGDNPTEIIYFRDGRPKELNWYLGGDYILGLHRPDDLPASKKYEIINDVYYLQSEIWSVNGKYHREGGPAVIYYFPNGQKKEERYYQADGLFRKDVTGKSIPPVIVYNEDGSIKEEKWYPGNNMNINWQYYDSSDEENDSDYEY